MNYKNIISRVHKYLEANEWLRETIGMFVIFVGTLLLISITISGPRAHKISEPTVVEKTIIKEVPAKRKRNQEKIIYKDCITVVIKLDDKHYIVAPRNAAYGDTTRFNPDRVRVINLIEEDFFATQPIEYD